MQARATRAPTMLPCCAGTRGARRATTVAWCASRGCTPASDADEDCAGSSASVRPCGEHRPTRADARPRRALHAQGVGTAHPRDRAASSISRWVETPAQRHGLQRAIKQCLRGLQRRGLRRGAGSEGRPISWRIFARARSMSCSSASRTSGITGALQIADTAFGFELPVAVVAVHPAISTLTSLPSLPLVHESGSPRTARRRAHSCRRRAYRGAAGRSQVTGQVMVSSSIPRDPRAGRAPKAAAKPARVS